MKLTIQKIAKQKDHPSSWAWDFWRGNRNEHVAGGYCATKKAAASDAAIWLKSWQKDESKALAAEREWKQSLNRTKRVNKPTPLLEELEIQLGAAQFYCTTNKKATAELLDEAMETLERIKQQKESK